jgi:hypothetical protein
MADRTSEGVRVCVRCGREGGLRDVRCAECGFDLTSDLQRDYDRYRSTTSGRGQSTSESIEGAQPRKKTAPNVHGALGRFTPAPGGEVLDTALDDSRRERGGRVSPVGSSSDVAARTRGGGQRVLGSTAMRPPAPPPPPSRLTGTHAPSGRRLQVIEAKQPPESVADLLARHSTEDDAPDEAGPRTTAWHPGSASDDAAVDPKLAPVGEGGPGDAPVTRAWGEVDEAREREAAAAAAASLEPALHDPLALTAATPAVEDDPVAAALAEAAAEALAAAVAPPVGPAASAGAALSDEGAQAAQPAAAALSAPPQPEDATVSLRVEDFVEALASFGLSDDDDDDDSLGARAAGAFDDGDDTDSEVEEGGGALAGAAAGDEATVMLQAVADDADERTVATPAVGGGEDADDDAADAEAPTVIAARPTATEALADPPAEDDDARTIVDVRSAVESGDGDDDADSDDGADTSETEAPAADAGLRAEAKRPGSRRKKRRRSGGGKGHVAAQSAPEPEAEATRAIAAMEPEPAAASAVVPPSAAPVSAAATARPAEAAPEASPRRGSAASASASTRPGDGAKSRPMPAASDAAMRAEALAPSRVFGARVVADPISQNLRPGTTTYVDATRKGFRRARAGERDGSGAYVVVGVVLGLIVLAALLYFSR